MADRTIFVVRVLAELPDDVSALRLAKSIEEQVSIHGKVQQVKAQRYWKDPMLFEASITLVGELSTTDIFTSILNELGEGWIRNENSVEENSAVWNQTGGRFFVSTVRWANVECFPESAQAQ